MARPEPLYDLVRSLTKAEKRRVRLQAERYGKREGGHAYLALFDRLERMPVYNAAALERAFGGRAHLASVKRYCLDAVLSALLAHEDSKRAVDRIPALMRQARLFEDKRIYYRAEALYRRALALAREQHRFAYAFEILARLRQLMGRWKAGGEREEAMDAVLADMEHFSFLLREWTLLQRLHSTLHREVVEWRRGGKGMGPEVDEQLASAWFRDAEHSPSNLNRLFHAVILGEYHIVSSRPEAAFEAMQRAAELATAEPAWQAENPSMYVSLLNNLMGRAYVLGRWDVVEHHLPELRDFRADDRVAEDRRFESWANIHLIHTVWRGADLDAAERRDIVEGLERPGMNRAFSLAIRLGMATLEAAHGRAAKARSWLRAFQLDPAHEKLRQHRMFADLLGHLLLVADGESDVLERELKRHRKRAAEDGWLLDVERLTVEHLLDWVRRPVAERGEALQALEEALAGIRDRERYAIFLDVDGWTEALRRGLPPARVRAERARSEGPSGGAGADDAGLSGKRHRF
jgi:hypothetical protein